MRVYIRAFVFSQIGEVPHEPPLLYSQPRKWLDDSTDRMFTIYLAESPLLMQSRCCVHWHNLVRTYIWAVNSCQSLAD